MKKIPFKSSDKKHALIFTAIHLAFCLLSLVGVILLFFSPLCEIEIPHAGKYTASAIKSVEFFNSEFYELSTLAPLLFACLFVIIFFFALCVARTVMAALSFKKEKKLLRFSRRTVFTACALALAYTAVAYLFAPLNSLISGFVYTASPQLFPAIFAIIIIVLYSVYLAITDGFSLKTSAADTDETVFLKDKVKKLRRSIFYKHLELFAFAIVSSAVAFVAMLSDIVTVSFDVPEMHIPNYVISGAELLFNPETLTTSSEPVLAFSLFLIFFVILISLLLTTAAFLSRSMVSTKLSLATTIFGAVATLVIGLFGKYYQIIQALSFDILTQIVVKYQVYSTELIQYNVNSSSIAFFAVSLVIIVVLLLRSPFTDCADLERQLKNKVKQLEGAEDESAISHSVGGSASASPENKEARDFDACPVFTELDKKAPELLATAQRNAASQFEDPTLSDLADFIVQYARDCRLHLFYTKETIAAFLAGLGTTRLTILQGMSGTGKTSLPKIVSEALLAYCHIIEVESSWRDKNELIGYYNEFNKVFTPKKFTQALYEAALNPDALTFIVLDEMNLSRIEYYFSDFLSLMENEPDKRELKISNIPLTHTEHGRSRSYWALSEGHTIKIPQNIWFIGTANRDESTYDISDKVYDRAHTMNFDRRAEKPQFFNNPIPPRSISASTLNSLFEEAKSKVNFKLEQAPVVAKVEELLLPYNISFGNRIANQIESFVSIYTSCFEPSQAVLHQALETILLSKVVKKLELKSIDDKELLAEEFEKLNLTKCSEFILSLKED